MTSVDFVNDSTGWAVGVSGTILKTTNGGIDWTTQESGTSFNLASVHFVNDSLGWAVIGSWMTLKTTSAMDSLEWFRFPHIQIYRHQNMPKGDANVLKTTNGGTEWVHQNIPNSVNLSKISFLDENRGWVVGTGYNWEGLFTMIYSTSDGGTNWLEYNTWSEINLYSIDFDNEGNGWAVGAKGVIRVKTKEGTEWWPHSRGYLSDMFSVEFVDANTGWAISRGMTDAPGGPYTWTILFYTIDGGEVWTGQSFSGIYYFSSDFIDVSNGWMVGAYYEWDQYGDAVIISTTSGGSNWTLQNSGISSTLHSVHFLDFSMGWAVGDEGTILKTTNGGTNWISKISGTSNDLQSIFFVDPNTGWAVGGTGTIIKTIDGGQNWEPQTSGVLSFLFSIDFIDADTGWVVGSSGVILKTTNGGTDWTEQTSRTSYWLRSVDFVDINNGWVVGNEGTIIKTTNSGIDWITQPSGTSNNLHSVCFINSTTGWAVGSGGAILKTTTGGTFVQEEDYPVEMPNSFILGQNYPNPFNSSTTIPFTVHGKQETVKSPIHTTLKIYNIRGQLVKTLLDHERSPGHHAVIWDGKDKKGNLVASGVYFYQLKVGEFTETKKLVLLK